jgi:hypothetical protein
MSGIVRGIIFGAVSVAVMLPMSFPDKLAAFLNRFAKTGNHIRIGRR